MATTENTTTRTTRDARKHLWLQFTDVERLDKVGLLVMAKADMAIVRDVEGREYIDGLAGLFTTQVGHGREEIARAVADRLTKLDFVSLFGFAHEPAIKLAARLAELTPGDLSVVNFANSGSKAVEGGIKIARQYHYIRGERNRIKIIACAGAFHGVTLGALSATGVRLRRAPYEPLVPGFVHVPPPDGYHTYPDLSESQPPSRPRRSQSHSTVATFSLARRSPGIRPDPGALINLAIIEREHLVKNAADVGDYLLSRLQPLRDLPFVGDVRGKGLLLGIELVSDKKRREKFPDAAEVRRDQIWDRTQGG